MGASKSLASPDQNVFPGLSESASLPAFFQCSSLDFQSGQGGWDMPSGCAFCLPALLLTEALGRNW